MAEVHRGITDELQAFIGGQQMFFVATAPSGNTGHVNLSPKGMDCFRILGPERVGYMDLIGSGNETSAHLLENGRITFMFCAFDGPPSLLRLYGAGHTVLSGSAEWEEMSPRFTLYPNTRQLIVADITRVQTSCGYAVPLYEFKGQRDLLLRWADTQEPAALAAYVRENNAASIDGLPSALAAHRTSEP